MKHDHIPTEEAQRSSQNIIPFYQHDPAISLPPPVSARGHQRSRTTVDLPPLFSRTSSSSPTRSSTFLPFFKTTNNRTKSPERKLQSSKSETQSVTTEEDEAEPSLKKSRPVGAVEKLASWFEGSSDPVNITLIPSPRKEQENPFSESQESEKMPRRDSEQGDGLTQKPQKMAMTNPPNYTPRLSFFRKASQPQSKQPSIEPDDLVQLDIRETLFPAGLPNQYSPAAFKNLQLNAEGTLRRFQNAHCEQRKQIQSLSLSTQSLSDELEAERTRSEHLRLQLQDMAQKVAEQEENITTLRNVLDESRTVQEVSERMKTIRMVPQERGVSQEDITSTPHRRYRRTRSSDISISAESEAESVGSSSHSVFSDFLSSIDSPGTSIAASPVMRNSTLHVTTVKCHNSSTDHHAVIPVMECQKCHGVQSSEAWDVINIMKMESVGLKTRIAELEGAQSDALDFLSGLNL